MSEISLTLKTPPAVDPVTLNEAKVHLRVDPDLSDDNALITSLIKAATETAQGFTHRQFVSATYELRFDIFPQVINLLRPPLISVTSVKYLDDAGATQTVDTAVYEVDKFSTVGRIRPKASQSWPSTGDFMGAVIIEYIAGYGVAAAVPKDILSAILLMIGHLYEHREDVLVGVAGNQIPRGANNLLFPHRILLGII